MPLYDDTIVHRVGGAEIENLRLSPLDATAKPPGISLLRDGTPAEAAETLRQAFRSSKWSQTEMEVGSATVQAIRAAGFDVIEAPTTRLPNHVRIIHPDGIDGFLDENLARLAAAFTMTRG